MPASPGSCAIVVPPPGVILAGGAARRMGGGDKWRLRLRGVALIDHVRRRLSPQVSALALNLNGDPGRAADLGLPVVADDVAGQPGPLAGILAAMEWAAARGADAVVTLPGDTPFPPTDLVARLTEVADGGVAIAASKATGRRHPTIGLWPITLRGHLRAALADGQRRVGDWADRHGAVACWFDGDPFVNINTPEDLVAAEARPRP